LRHCVRFDFMTSGAWHVAQTWYIGVLPRRFHPRSLMKTQSRILAATFFLVATARADVTPHVLFTNNMVLQANREIPAWGTAGPGERVQVILRGDGIDVQDRTIADAKGRWLVRLPKQAATKEDANPCTLTVVGKNSLEFKNVLVGEVWLASGQSNMQWSVRDSADPEKTAAGATDARLRLYTGPRIATPAPMTTIPSKPAWQECSPKTSIDFSAVAYHFGAHLRKALKVPVGLIHTSFGGTPCEAWTSREALQADPSLAYYNAVIDKA